MTLVSYCSNNVWRLETLSSRIFLTVVTSYQTPHGLADHAKEGQESRLQEQAGVRCRLEFDLGQLFDLQLRSGKPSLAWDKARSDLLLSI